jgi:hypothetical protein
LTWQLTVRSSSSMCCSVLGASVCSHHA